MQSTHSPSNKVKILVLNHEDAESEEIPARLKVLREQLAADVEIEIEYKNENVDPSKTAAYIREGRYDLVLVGEAVKASACRLMIESSERKDFPGEKPRFHFAAKAEILIDHEIKQSGFSGSIIVAKAGKPNLRAGYAQANQQSKEKIRQTLNSMSHQL